MSQVSFELNKFENEWKEEKEIIIQGKPGFLYKIMSNILPCNFGFLLNFRLF